MDRISVPELTGTNYFIWSLKMQGALSLKRLDSVTMQMKPEGLSEKDALEWEQKNSDAVAYIKLSLSDEQALQFAAENNAKILWDKIKSTFTGQTEDRKMDAGNELKNLQINSNELANDYIARARGIATKCHSLGLDVSPRELVYYTVRGLKGKFAKVQDILKTQRDKSIDEVLEILREEETSFNSPSSTRAEGRSADVFYSRKSKNSGMRLCYVCRRPNHVAKDCFYRNQKESTTTSRRRKVHRNNNSKERNTANPVFTASPNEESLCENIWILDSGASCHMAKDRVWFEKIFPERKYIYLAGKDSKIICKGFGTVKAKTPESYGGAKYFMVLVDDFSGMYFTYFLKNKNEVFDIFSQFKTKYENLTDKRIKKLRTDNGLEFVNEQLDTYLDNSGIFHEKTIPYNSESNGKAERANRILLERARSLLYESELPLKFWAEAINFSTQVSNVTPRKGKEKIPLETWIGKKPKLNYLKKFGCVAYFHVPKVMRNKFDIPGRRGIMLGYARDRRGYRIYDIKNRKIIEERSIKFNESLKGSTYLGKTKVETWNIDSLFESTQDINEFDHKTKVNHLEISAEPAANKNNYSIPFETPDDATNTVGGEIETPVDQIPVRRSERLKAKQMSTNLACNVPNFYLEAKNSADWQNWEFAMKNELDSLNKHKVWEIVDRPAKTKLVKSKWVYSLKQSDNGETKYKARLVAAGFNQIKNKDYLESYSPVVNIESFRLLIALASKLNLMVKFFDVKTAYLYSDIEETVYMLPPPGFERLVGDGKVCKLKRSIYGLPQSGRNWYMKIKSELEKFGLTQLASDNCVFIKSDGQNMLLLCMHVDDLAIFCNNDEMYQDTVNSIKSVFEVHENKTSKFLGMEIVKHKNGISLSQSKYIESLLVKYNLNECKSVKTPIVKGEDKSFPPTNELIDITMYQELIGELLYLANRTRPDISFVTCYLSQFNHKPEKRHYILAKRVLRYLMGTKDKKLFYDNNFGFVNANSDASWGNAENGKSFSGGVILLALHWLNPSFKKVTFSKNVKDVFKSLQYKDPVVVQSMVIFKHPEIGGLVTPHQDSTFLYTEPQSAVGLWIPLVDITLQNGCLWFIPGSHKDKIYQRYVRNPSGNPQLVLKGKIPEFDESLYVPVLPKKGDCVVIHGSVIHKSGKNTSENSRPIYTFHVVEQKGTEFSKENWLQPSEVLPFPSVYSN
ncbi:Retrovirus-related Pol polyprotein from transposon TNT 1-94 [Araneus ventricosus]|uniref:Retrovirus-related Pol polyprotein from transposon TNT 1-94 n=1 Tax=Araneus ventricosus TaxID=182803 RepID=A0A4Y2MEU9_ARAVE|nr:Retrovirus-related Pol polyprotein from transposon TNT 1-94 [Araneus ventricosus]